MSFGITPEELQAQLAASTGVTSWWDEYKSYVWFAVGGVAGWTLAKLISSPTVVIRSDRAVTSARSGMRGWRKS